jgi:hypothetical protein
MAAQVGSVIFAISADLKGLQSQLRTMEGNFQSSFGKIEGIAKNFGKGLLTGIAGGLSVGALVGFTKQVIDLGDKLSDLSDQTGLSIEVLGGIRPIAQQNGSSLEAFAGGVAKAQKNLGLLNNESPGVAQSLKRIGLNVEDLIRLNPDQFIETLAKGLASIPNHAERAAVSSQILSKGFQELGPTILNIAENGLPRLSKETAEAYRHLGELKDQSDALSAKLQDLGATALVTAGKILGLISLPPIERAGQLQIEVDRLSASLAKIQGVPKELIDAKTIDQLKEIEKSLPVKTFLDKVHVRPGYKRTAQDQNPLREEQERKLKTVNQTK